MGFFPVDNETLAYLRFSGREDSHVEVVERVLTEQGLFHHAAAPEPRFTDKLELDLGDVVPSIAGPKRPQDRIPLTDSKKSWQRRNWIWHSCCFALEGQRNLSQRHPLPWPVIRLSPNAGTSHR